MLLAERLDRDAKGELKYSLAPISKDQTAAVALSILEAGQDFRKLIESIEVEMSERHREQLPPTQDAPAAPQPSE
jgi:hypothetical protein